MKYCYHLPAQAARPWLLALLLGGAACRPAGAQALNYFAVNAQPTNTTYTDLGTTGTAIATANTDDANSAAQPLEFAFSYGGASYSQFVLNTNGYLKLGGAAPVGPYFSNGAQDIGGGPLGSVDTNLLLPFNTDLEAGTSPTEYRVATTGAVGRRITTIQWKNVSDKARAASLTSPTVVPKQYTNFSFQVRLYEGSNAIDFTYGPATSSGNTTVNSVVGVGLKGNGTDATQLTTVGKQATSSWIFPVFQDGGYPAGGGFGIRSTTLPDANRTYHFDAAVPNDAALTALYGIEQLPAGQAYAYQTLVVNKGNTPQTDLVVTLSLSGDNQAALRQTVASLAPGAKTLLTWPRLTLPNAGLTTIAVALPADATPTNNNLTATTATALSSATTPAVFSYLKPGSPVNGGYGFGPIASPFTGICYAAYGPTSAFTFTFVRALLGRNAVNVGQKVYGVLADASGSVLGQSAEYTIQTSDLGTLHTFALPTPIAVLAGTAVLAGLAQQVTTVLFFATGTQPETPGRSGTYYTFSNPYSSGRLSDINASGFNNLRFLIEAGNGGGALATATPALAQSLTVFPNPSATGQVSLAIGGANAPAGLAVTVLNPLGQVVYTGTARDNATTPLDLGPLATGLYRVQVRHGNTFASQPLSIVR
ncbi:hypothetical protein GCM10027422_24410 [Hymenobacter arcticus]